MNQKYRALVKTAGGAGNIEVKQVSVREPGPHEVLLELIYAGICHTDINMINGAYDESPGYSPHYPIVLGHEFTARVVQVGPEVDDLQPGTRVVSGCHNTCGQCRWCREGRSMLCLNRQVIGLDVDGCWAERFIMPRRNLVSVPDSISDKLAAIAEPFAVGAHAVDLAEIRSGERIAVVGPGPIGLLTLGALVGHQVTVIGRAEDERLFQIADKLGAFRAGTFEDFSDELGYFDVILEAAGSSLAVEEALPLLGPGGRLVCIGLPTTDASVSTAELAWKEQSVIGSRAYDLSTWRSIPQRLEMIPSLENVVTHTVSLSQLDEALHLLQSRQALKVLLHP